MFISLFIYLFHKYANILPKIGKIHGKPLKYEFSWWLIFFNAQFIIIIILFAETLIILFCQKLAKLTTVVKIQTCVILYKYVIISGKFGKIFMLVL